MKIIDNQRYPTKSVTYIESDDSLLKSSPSAAQEELDPMEKEHHRLRTGDPHPNHLCLYHLLVPAFVR
jgi:hypothetical protein